MAGLAVTRALYRHAASSSSSLGVAVTVFDPAAPGTCLGATAVAAGLLHPLSPRGKVVWGGEEGLAATLRLVQEAQRHLDLAATASLAPGGPRVSSSFRRGGGSRILRGSSHVTARPSAPKHRPAMRPF